MGLLVTKVKPREIIVHLPCLTDHDIESIETKNDFSGSFEAMKLLLSCMKRRENWPEQFIDALERCRHETIAAEIRAEYNKLRGINNSSPPPPAPPASNVVTAHVHPAPSAPHLPDPVSAATALPTWDVPSEAHETNPIQETETPTKSTLVLPAAPVVEVTTPPEPPHVQAQPQTQAVVVPPATPPPSPESTRGSTNPSPPPEQVGFPRQEPEENLEPDHVQVQGVPNEAVNIPQEAEANTEVPLAAEPKDEPCEIGDSTLVDLLTPAAAAVVNDTTLLIDTVDEPIVIEPEQVSVVEEDPTQNAITEKEEVLTTTSMDNPVVPPVVSPARSSSPLTNLDDLTLTPEKPPVQETSPREERVPSVVPVLEDTPEPQNTQMVETVQATPSSSVEVENGDRGSEDEDIFFSKPGVLMSSEPPHQNNTTIRPPSPESSPYSGDSARLEMSEEASFQENGFSHEQEVKDVSESPAPSLEEDDVEESIGHVAEEPSILNKEIQTPVIDNSVQPAEEIPAAVSLVAETTLLSEPSSYTNADLSENLVQEEGQPSFLNQENQAPLTEDTEEQAMCCPTESPAPSLDMEDVRENVGHVAEEPSILNLEVQTPLLQVSGELDNEMTTATVISDATSSENVAHKEGKTLNQEVQPPIIQINGEPTKEVTPVPPEPAPANNDNNQPNDPLVDQKLPDLGSGTTNRLNRRHILTAAGVGACALLIAWRFKH